MSGMLICFCALMSQKKHAKLFWVCVQVLKKFEREDESVED